AEETGGATPAAAATLRPTPPRVRQESSPRAPIAAPKPPATPPAREPPRPIRTEAIEAIAERLRQRGGSSPHALAGLDCPACGVLGVSYSDDEPDSPRTAAAAALARLARPERGWSLLECPRCGALFRQTASGPPAADSLFERT